MVRANRNHRGIEDIEGHLLIADHPNMREEVKYNTMGETGGEINYQAQEREVHRPLGGNRVDYAST